MERDAYLRKKKETALTKCAPEIERVSNSEVYLLENGERVKRICGAPRRGVPSEYVCLAVAGTGTDHNGEGYCVKHSPDHALDDKYWRKLNTANDIPVDIQELYEDTVDLNKAQVFSITNLMQRTMILYWDILQNPELKDKETGKTQLSHWQRQELRKLDRQMIDLIESERKLDNQGRLKGATISGFLQAIFAIINSTLDANKAKLLMNRIMKITYTQHDDGKISGDLNDLDKKVVSFEMEIKAKEDAKDREIITDAKIEDVKDE